MKKLTLTMTLEQAQVLQRSLEVIARIGMLQFKDMFELINPNITWDESTDLENLIKHYLTELGHDHYYSIQYQNVAEESQVAWDAYQHIRRELSWHKLGKDWRKDPRDLKEMRTVNYDEPMKVSKIKGEFEAKILEVK
jgi:hypothetical protein